MLNKSDLVPVPTLLPLTASLTALAEFEQTFMVSAATGDGIEQLADALAGGVPEGPHLYPDDDLTDLPDRLLAAEIVREQIFLQTHEEVPYGTTVETENWQDRNDGSVRIEATVYVARPGHKAILIGEGGKRIKTIGARARVELASLLERKVHLFLNVKHRAGWDEEAARLRAIGLRDPEQYAVRSSVAATMRPSARFRCPIRLSRPVVAAILLIWRAGSPRWNISREPPPRPWNGWSGDLRRSTVALMRSTGASR